MTRVKRRRSEHLRVAVFLFGHSFWNGRSVTTDQTFQHMLVPLLDRSVTIDLCTPVATSMTKRGRETIDPTLNVLRLSGTENGRQLYITRLPAILWRCFQLFRRCHQYWDVVWIVDTEVHSQFVYLLCKLFGVPAFLYIRGRDELQLLRANRERGIRKTLSIVLGWWLQKTIPVMVAHMPTVVTGSDLYEMYRGRARHLHVFVSSLIQSRDPLFNTPQRSSHGGGMTVLTVGRVAPVKGLHYLINALPDLRPVDVKLRIVGPVVDSYYAELCALVERLNLKGNVEFVGPVPFGQRLRQYYIDADIYVQPSLMEGTPKTIMEAMAVGLPIIASRIGGIPQLIEDGFNGFLVPPGDSDALCRALTRMLDNPETRQQMGRRARERAHEFSLDRQLAGLLEFLETAYPQLVQPTRE